MEDIQEQRIYEKLAKYILDRHAKLCWVLHTIDGHGRIVNIYDIQLNIYDIQLQYNIYDINDIQF